MKQKEGNIVDIVNGRIFKGRIFFNERIVSIEESSDIEGTEYIIPGLIDAHVHIESSMLTPLEYSKVALKNGVVAAVTDPHEIANVCGIEGVRFMIANAKASPMKLFFGAPSCVPATAFETSGASLSGSEINELFENKECTHLSEMMNYPGVIHNNDEVMGKIAIAKKHGKIIDGHAPLLTGHDLRRYVGAGISTDHECTSVLEALEKISLGMKIMLRNSSASKDFDRLISLIKTHPDEVMLCTDDCHPDELEQGYINLLVKKALDKGYDLIDILRSATKTAKDLYELPVGLLQVNDAADFLVISNISEFRIKSTFINGVEVYSKEEGLSFSSTNESVINQFYTNQLDSNSLQVRRTGSLLKVIQIIENSLLTESLNIKLDDYVETISTNIQEDILKIVVVNRYKKAKPAVGFIKGFNLKRGAIAGTIAHDSHNIVAVGVSDSEILSAIERIQQTQGGLIVVDNENSELLPLPIAGLMSDLDCHQVATRYKELSAMANAMGSTLHAPFMTLAFMSLLVIPELKIGDQGLFDVNTFQFVALQE
ncbi:MAG: adenine deaminase [Prolixibacteraceae bacterium]